jgi:hypothetical protein
LVRVDSAGAELAYSAGGAEGGELRLNVLSWHVNSQQPPAARLIVGEQ